MKRKTMIGPAVFLLVLCLAFAAAGEGSDYAGKWVTVALTSLDSPEWNLPIPAQLDTDMPELEIDEGGTARWTVGQTSREGTWTHGAEAGEILLALEDEAAQPIVLRAEKDQLTCETDVEGIGKVQLSFGREEPSEIIGKWGPLLQTYGDGEYWMPFPGAGSTEFKADGTGIYTESNGTGSESKTEFTWRRAGNDIITSVQAAFPDGTAGEFPFIFYQLEQGLLKQYVLRGEEEYVLLICSREGNAPDCSDIDSVNPLLNTAWELAAIDVSGTRVPLSVLGIKTEEYLAFSKKGTGRLIHLNGEELKQIKFTWRTEKGTLHLIVKGHDPIPCRWADGEYLIRETASGQKLYYRQKSMAGSQ